MKFPNFKMGSAIAQSLSMRLQKANSQTPLRQKVIFKKVGFFASIFHPLAIAVGFLIAVYGMMSLGVNFYHGLARDHEYRKNYHIDRSVIEIFQSSNITKDKVELIVRNFDGELETRLASKSQIQTFLKKQAMKIENARQASKLKMQFEMATLFATAFADRDAAIDSYANWFFEWKRPYVILKEAISSTTSRLFKLGEYESLRTAVERDVSDYFMAHYKTQVLKPEQREPIIIDGIEKIARSAHKDYLVAMDKQTIAVREFLQKHTRHLNTAAHNQAFTKTSLDWDAQRWKNPTYLMEDRAFDGIIGLGGIATSGTIGGFVLGPSINRGLAGIFQPLARRFATSMGARITLAEGGAAAGTLVEPVGGTLVGAAIGVAVGFAADYVANKINEKFSRGKFVTANHQAIDSTINLWQGKLSEHLEAGVNNWWDDAKASLILSKTSNSKPEDEEQLRLW